MFFMICPFPISSEQMIPGPSIPTRSDISSLPGTGAVTERSLIEEGALTEREPECETDRSDKNAVEPREVKKERGQELVFMVFL